MLKYMVGDQPTRGQFGRTGTLSQVWFVFSKDDAGRESG